MNTTRLEVRQVDEGDTFKDIARIHDNYRPGVSPGTICKVTVGTKWRYLSVRGLPDRMLKERRLSTETPAYILVDEVTRSRLGLKVGDQYDFTFPKAKWWGRIWWAYGASDPAASVSTFIATWSFVLGIVSVVLGVWSLCLSMR
jgi:hypothetical protein